MSELNPLLNTDFYKIHHFKMYPDGMTKLYSNLTPRKSRVDGEVTSSVPYGYDDSMKHKTAVVIDDICDGGATFIKTSDALRHIGHEGDHHLCVTHGIFSKGFSELRERFSRVYCTDSYRVIQDSEWKKDDAFELIQVTCF